MNAVTEILDDFPESIDFSTLSQDTRRRALRLSIAAMLLCARGNGATEAEMKALVLHLRSPDVAILTNSDAFEILDHLGLRSA